MIYKEFEDKIEKEVNPLFKIDRQAYKAGIARTNKEFREALFKHHGIENNPKKDMCFDLAWEHAHSPGYSEIEIYFDDFVRLIK